MDRVIALEMENLLRKVSKCAKIDFDLILIGSRIQKVAAVRRVSFNILRNKYTVPEISENLGHIPGFNRSNNRDSNGNIDRCMKLPTFKQLLQDSCKYVGVDHFNHVSSYNKSKFKMHDQLNEILNDV